ncbi:hypothetical protein Esi_0495_0007 [Ectocarpus siliculosus]|uniref:Uncharacterized protein n=1 Tax=Ectocarpus siliculosus TaxID=2880 RepID=D7G342_ECTSI|nr:hypothetical protein Esi_0495_0007 [Ectocarpus siliculosus]|eukprot:CBJ33485.1 hypothetical protein Esi_0495_0007 [Ectocarpus siliculosus]
MTTPAPAAATSISTSSPAEEVDTTSSPSITVDGTMAPTMSRYLSTVDVYVEFWECSSEFRSCSMDDDLAASCGDDDDGLDDGAFGDEDLSGTVATGYSRAVLALVLPVSFFVALPQYTEEFLPPVAIQVHRLHALT